MLLAWHHFFVGTEFFVNQCLETINRSSSRSRVDAHAASRMGCSGFFRCSGVRAALAPREPEPGSAFGGASSRFAASAKQRRLRQAFIARPPPHPSHSCACEGPPARKTLRDRGAASASLTRTDYGSNIGPYEGACAALAVGEGFCGASPRHAKPCRGCGDGTVKNARRRFSGLAKEPRLRGEASEVGATRVRARPSHRSTEKPE